MSNDTAGHPRIDFAWGNMPMQPNDERGIHPLDPVLDSHEIAYLGWNGYPAYVPNTSHTGGGSGSGGSGSGPTLVQVPAPLSLESFDSYVARLQALGLLGNASSVNNLDSPSVNNTIVPFSVFPNPGQSVSVGTTVAFSYFASYPDTYTFQLYITNNWAVVGGGQQVNTMGLAWGALPSDLVANPTNYRVNLTGFSDGVFSAINGVYNLTAVTQNGPSPLFTISGLTLPGGAQTLTSTESGAINGYLVIFPV